METTTTAVAVDAAGGDSGGCAGGGGKRRDEIGESNKCAETPAFPFFWGGGGSHLPVHCKYVPWFCQAMIRTIVLYGTRSKLALHECPLLSQDGHLLALYALFPGLSTNEDSL